MRHKVNRNYHVPYLAGYSKDGRTVYIDKRVPTTIKTKAGDTVDIIKYLTIHESYEKGLEDAEGLKYQAAHAKATAKEREAVEGDGHDWTAYQEAMAGYYEHARTEFTRASVPADLDLEPYRDMKDTAILRKLGVKHGK